MNWFEHINTVEDLKKKQKELAKKFHPDVNPGTDESIMTDINMQFQDKIKNLMGLHKKKEKKPEKTKKIPKIELTEKEADELIHNLSGLTNLIFKIGAKKIFSISSKK